MKTMFRVLALVGVAAVLAVSVYGQGKAAAGKQPPRGRPMMGGPGGPPPNFKFNPKEMAARQTKYLKEVLKPRLKLTDAQVKKIQALYDKNNKTVATIMADKKMKPEDRMKKFRAFREANNKAMNAILTKKQQAELEKLRQERRRMGGPGMRPGGPPPGKAASSGSGKAK